jgi:hypothetical protein
VQQRPSHQEQDEWETRDHNAFASSRRASRTARTGGDSSASANRSTSV